MTSTFSSIEIAPKVAFGTLSFQVLGYVNSDLIHPMCLGARPFMKEEMRKLDIEASSGIFEKFSTSISSL